MIRNVNFWTTLWLCLASILFLQFSFQNWVLTQPRPIGTVRERAFSDALGNQLHMWQSADGFRSISLGICTWIKPCFVLHSRESSAFLCFLCLQDMKAPISKKKIQEANWMAVRYYQLLNGAKHRCWLCSSCLLGLHPDSGAACIRRDRGASAGLWAQPTWNPGCAIAGICSKASIARLHVPLQLAPLAVQCLY